MQKQMALNIRYVVQTAR